MSTIINEVFDSLDALREVLREDVLLASRALLGWRLLHGDLAGQIVETEAYRTPDDPGCHAHRGPTARDRPMYGDPGTAYLYFTYGHHWMLNVVAHPCGHAAAVLIRAALPIHGHSTFRVRRPKARSDRDLLSGPGKLASAFGLDGSLNGADLLDPASPLRLVPGEPAPDAPLTTRRIGLRPGSGDDLPWRFCDPRYPEWLSRPCPNQVSNLTTS